MNYVVIMFAFALLCGVLSMLFFSGRGAKLIAGYNTSTPEQRARYDERKLCRAMGLVMVGAFFALGTMALAELARMQGAISCDLSVWVTLMAVFAMAVGIFFGIRRMNTTCLRQP